MKTVRIYGGHSRTWGDPGAVSDGFIEAELNKIVAKAACDFLAPFDCVVHDGTDKTGTDNIVAAKNEKADALVCVHHNAGGGDGCEVYYWHTDEISKALAEEIIRQFVAIGQNSRGVKKSTPNAYNFAPCREMAKVGMVGVLGEFAFVDNKTDRQIIDTEIELINEGKAYGKAIVNFLGLKLKTPVTPPVVAPALKSIEEIAREVINGKWGNGQDRVDRLNAAGYDAITVQAVVNKLIVANKPTTTPPSPPKAGDVYNLTAKPLYLSATAKVSLRKISGTYYLYDGKKINGRYRITNSKSRVNKTPAAFNVTGWVVL